MQYCVIFGTVLEEFLSEPTVLRFHKTNTNLVNFDAVLRFLQSFFVRFLRPLTPSPLRKRLELAWKLLQ